MKYWVSLKPEYPKEKAIYCVREGRNPLPSIYNRFELPVLLKALVLDGWLSYREADRILKLVEVEEFKLDYLASLWGEPFETLACYFYGKTAKLDKLPEEVLDFWIVPEFQLTSFTAVLLKRVNSPIVLGDVDLLNDEQLRFLLRFLKYEDWICSRSVDFRLLNQADFAVLDSSANLEVFLRHHAGLKRALETSKKDYLPVKIREGLFITDREYTVEAVKFGSGPIPKKTMFDRFKIVFGEHGEIVFSLLDEMVEAMPVPWGNFWKLVLGLDVFIKNREAAEKIIAKMLEIGIVEIQAGSVIITSKGLDWLAEKEKMESAKREGGEG